MDDDIGSRQRAVHRIGGRLHQFPGVFEREAPRQRQREVGKVTRARAPHTRLLDRYDAFHLLDFSYQPPPRLCRNLVHQHGHSLAAQQQREPQNHDAKRRLPRMGPHT